MKKFILLTAITIAVGAMTSGCGNSDKKKVTSFAENFAQQLKKNNRDSILHYYPGSEFAENFEVAYYPDSLTVNKMDQEGQYKVVYNSGASMIVELASDGSIHVKESNGLFKYSDNKMRFAQAVGGLKPGLNDEELSKVMTNVENLSTELYNSYVENRKNGIKNLGFTITKDIIAMMDLGEGYYTLKNTTDQMIGGEEYEITWNNRYMGVGGDLSEKKIEVGGRDIPAHESIRIEDTFSGHSWREIVAITVHTPSKEDFYKNYTPTGDEYLAYVKVNGEEPEKKKSLGYGPFTLTGKIDGKYPIHLTLEKGMKTGSYYYDKNGPKATLSLSIKEYNENTGELTFEEKNDKGEKTGTFVGVLSSDSFKGKMTSFQGKTYECNLKVSK